MNVVGNPAPTKVILKISKIEKKVSIDHTRNCIQTSTKNKKIYPRIHSTVKVIRACIFIMLAVLEVTQRVPPTCIIKTDFTYHFVDRSGCRRGKKDCHCDCAAFDVGSSMKFATDVCSRHSTKHHRHHLSKKKIELLKKTKVAKIEWSKHINVKNTNIHF